MKALPTTPAMKEIFGHWAVLLAVVLGISLFYGIFSAARDGGPSARKPSDFSARFVTADDAAFKAAMPSLMVRALPDVQPGSK